MRAALKIGLSVVLLSVAACGGSTTDNQNHSDGGTPDGGNGGALQATLTAAPTSATAGASVSLTASVVNASGQPVQGAQVQLSVSGGDNTLHGGPATGADGKATFQLSSTKAETKTITASVNANGQTAQAGPLTVTIQPDEAWISGSTVTPDKQTVNADGVDAVTLSVVVGDRYGNPISNTSVTAVATSGDGVSCTSATSDAQGAATVRCTFHQVGNVSIDLHADGNVLGSVNVSAVQPVPDASRSSLTASSGAVAAGTPVQLEVAVLDANGNGINGARVHLAASPAAGTFSPGSDLTTDATGHATASFTSDTIGLETVVATVGTMTVGSVQVGFQGGPPTDASSSFNSTAPSGVPEGTPVAFDALLYDVNGHPVSGAVLAFFDTSGVLLTDPADQVTTDGDGKASLAVTFYVPGNASAQICVAASAPITTTSDCLFRHTVGQIVTAVPSPGNSSLTSDFWTSQVDQLITFTVTLRDVNNHPATNIPVTIEATGSDNFLSAHNGLTDDSGEVTFTLNSHHAEDKTVTVKVDGVEMASRQVTFTHGPAVRLAMSGEPAQVHTGDPFPAPVTVQVTDAYDNLVDNWSGTVSVALTCASSSTLGGTLSQSIPAGVAVFPDLSITHSGASTTCHLTASAGTPPPASVNSADITVLPAAFSVIANATTLSGKANQVRLDPMDASVVFIADEAGLFTGTTTGSGWTWENLGLNSVSDVTVPPTNDQHLYAVSSGVLYVSLNGGNSWSQASLSGTPTGNVVQVAAHPAVTARLTLGMDGSGLYDTSDGAYFHPMGVGGDILALGYRATGTGGASVRVGILQTAFGTEVGWYEDGSGGVWNPLMDGVPTDEVPASLLVGNGGALYMTTASGNFYGMATGTTTWSLLSSGSVQRLIAVAPSDDQRLYSNLGLSTDGGHTWQPVSLSGTGHTLSQVTSMAISQDDPAVVYITYGASEVARSSTGGL